VKRSGDHEIVDAAEARFQRFLEKLHALKQQRIHRPAGWPIRRWLPIAVALVVIAVLLFEPRNVVINADTLVAQASRVERARPAAGLEQRVHITLTPPNGLAMPGFGVASYTTEQDVLDGIVTTSGPTTLEGTPAMLSQRLARHRFNWRQPLSAICFDSWRRALPHKHDEVIARNGSNGSPELVLRTTTADDGDLREVELTIERDSYRVSHEVFVFDDIGRLEIDQSLQWTRHIAPAPAPAPSRVASTLGKRPVRDRVEPLEARSIVAQPDLGRWLDRRYGDTADRDSFMPKLRRLTGAVRQHLDGLQDLEGRYPGADGAQSSPVAHARFQRQVDLQFQTLRDDLDALAPQILVLTFDPKNTSQLSAPASREEPAPPDWSRRVDAGKSYAFQLDRLVDELRAYDDPPLAVQHRLTETYGALRSTICAPSQKPSTPSR
jgi:hypothetical protein